MTTTKEPQDGPDFVPVTSSNIDAIALHEGKLFVRFNNGNVYSYADDASDEVESLHMALVQAEDEGESVGRLFHALVRVPNIKADKIEA